MLVSAPPSKWVLLEKASCETPHNFEGKKMCLQRLASYPPGSLRNDTSHKLCARLPVFLQLGKTAHANAPLAIAEVTTPRSNAWMQNSSADHRA
jgi:hypothetical protein